MSPFDALENLIALFCTASSFCIKAASAVSHRTSAYSNIGRHRLKYARSLADWRASFRAVLMHPRTMFCTVDFASYVSVKL